MAYGVQPDGFVSKTQPEIVQELTDDANSAEFFGANFPTSPDSVYGNLVQIFATALKDSGWDLAESVYNQFNRDKAEGKNLDDLAALIGLSRIQASGSTGQLLFKGSNGSTVPANTGVNNTDQITVTTDETLVYDRQNCNLVNIEINTLIANTDYDILVEGVTYTVNSGTNPTVESLITNFEAAIGSQPTYVATTENDDTTLVITYTANNNVLSVTVDSNLAITVVGSYVNATTVEEGAISVPANTLTQFETVPVGTISVNNPQSFELGRSEETDEELRLRMSEKESSTGTATIPAIESSLSEVEGVGSAIVIENETLSVDGDGRPPKSYECIVTGGTDQDVATTIWETKPAGIKLFGNTLVVIIDSGGTERPIYFSRPDTLYAWVNVTYTLYDEEVFPSDGEQAMAQAVVDYGNGLGQGVDIIPQRFNGKLFDAVDGLESVVTEIGLSTSSTTPPTSYVTTPIPVDDSERPLFDVSRVVVSI
ncbi:MAG: hypothetical protein GY861_11670 [bacterium]|nr:hypothetical protein [bacterium]